MFEKIAANLPDEIYQEFRFALVKGQWRNGMQLTDRQRLTCIQVLYSNEENRKLQVNNIH